jgi:ribose transport system permease protein
MTSRRFDLGFDRFSGLYLWVMFIIVFSLWAPQTFPTMATVHLLASTQAVAGIVALGLLVAMAAGQFDVSVGATANLAGIVAAMVQLNGIMSAVPAALLGILVGLVVGFTNGFIVVKLKVNSFVGTLGMSSVLTALLVLVTNNQEPLPVESAFFNGMTQKDFFGFQYVVFYLIILAILLWWVLGKTPAGRYMYAVGSNPEAARLSGVSVNKWSWIALTASGGICGLGGVLFVSLTGPSLGFGGSLLLPAFASVFLGSTQLFPGKLNVWGTLLAIFVIATGVQGLQLVSGVQWVAALFNGIALIAAVALAAGRERRNFRGRGSRRLASSLEADAAAGSPVPPSEGPPDQAAARSPSDQAAAPVGPDSRKE